MNNVGQDNFNYLGKQGQLKNGNVIVNIIKYINFTFTHWIQYTPEDFLYNT